MDIEYLNIDQISGQWVTIHKARSCYIHFQMYFQTLLRKLSGPQPLHWVEDSAKLSKWHPTRTDMILSRGMDSHPVTAGPPCSPPVGDYSYHQIISYKIHQASPQCKPIQFLIQTTSYMLCKQETDTKIKPVDIVEHSQSAMWGIIAVNQEPPSLWQNTQSHSNPTHGGLRPSNLWQILLLYSMVGKMATGEPYTKV